MSGTVCCWGVGWNGIGGGFFAIIIIPHGDSLLADFVKLQRAEAGLKKIKSSPLLRSEEIKQIVWRKIICTGRHMLHTYKVRSIKIKWSVASNVRTSMESKEGIYSRESTSICLKVDQPGGHLVRYQRAD